MNYQQKKQAEKYAQHYAGLLNTTARMVDPVEKTLCGTLHGSSFCYCDVCRNSSCKVSTTCLYGCSEAARWQGSYIYYCPEGLLFLACSISDEDGVPAVGMAIGPMVMGEVEDLIAEAEDPFEAQMLRRISVISTRKANDAAELLRGTALFLSGVSEEPLTAPTKEQIEVYAADSTGTYSLEVEKKLQVCLRSGDKSGAQTLLNELLVTIYCSSDFDLNRMKIRLVELASVLSRAAIDAGADPSEVLWLNTTSIPKMQEADSFELLSRWISGILHRFIQYSFDFSHVKHSDTVYKVMEYIRQNYTHRLTLEEIAAQVHFSKAYLSRIFREETGMSIPGYVNQVRIERSKLLLLEHQLSLADIAAAVGFEDQSYFTKLFRQSVGLSPKKFMEYRRS